jgi:hypothetical protein
VSLRRSPRLSPAALAANRANACRSTGPRSVHGKARAALNSLKHGRYAVDLPQRLGRARCPQAEAEWHATRSRIAQAFAPANPTRPACLPQACLPQEPSAPEAKLPDRVLGAYQAIPKDSSFNKKIDRMANWVWSAYRNWQHDNGTKPERGLESDRNGISVSQPSMNWSGIAIRHPWARLGLVFYVQRRRGWRRRQLSARLWESLGRYPGAGSWKPPASGPELETGLRSRIYRLGRPRYWEQIRYCLDRRGCYHPEWRGPYRKVRQQLRDSGQGVWLEPHPIRALMRQQQQATQAGGDQTAWAGP